MIFLESTLTPSHEAVDERLADDGIKALWLKVLRQV